MFNVVGRAVARHPRVFIIFWLVLVALGALGALWGFGQGPLFERMSSSTSMVPGSESDRVLQRTTDSDTYMVLVSGVAETDPAIRNFRYAANGLAGVDTVTDPVSLTADVKVEIENQIYQAIEKAKKDNASKYKTAQDYTLATQRSRLEQLEKDEGAAARKAAEKEIIAEVNKTVDESIAAEVRKAVAAETEKMADPADSLRAEDSFVVLVAMQTDATDAEHAGVAAKITELNEKLTADNSQASASAVSSKMISDLILDRVAQDLVRGETFSLPVALILLVIIFGGILAAGLPLTAAIASILIGMGSLWLITLFTGVDSFVLNIVTIIGLALSVDYGLLMVSRYREEVEFALEKRELPTDGTVIPDDVAELVHEAVQGTVATAGRTVTFSALTIALSISGLLAMQAPILRLVSIGGIIITMFAVATSLTLVPSIIVLLGNRLVKPSKLMKVPGVNTLVRKVGDTTSDEGIFSGLARWVHGRPWPVLIVTVLILLAMALPIKDMQIRSNFIDYVPASAEKTTYDTIQQDYPDLRTPDGTILANVDLKLADPFITQVKKLEHVTRVSTPQELEKGWISFSYYTDTDDPVGQEAIDTVTAVRALEPGYRFDVGGAGAMQADFNQSLIDGAPVAVGIVVLSVLVLLFLLTGSIVAPLKALIINTLSLVASLGITVFLFENGLLGVPQTPGLETFVVATAAAFGFGLAMDYEVFLVARIKEFWDEGHDNDAAVEKGMQRSGRIITSAAAIIVAVFLGFVGGDMLPIKQIGVALSIIVAVDATVVRLLLVPSFMTLIGKWNWWAPKQLRKIYQRINLAD
ncbi:MAG: MMPL family transporter [Trueperella sp.]|nr:MMPL family transporter [Trueperella sp.]